MLALARRTLASRVARPRASGLLLVALIALVTAPACTSYRRALEPEPGPAPASGLEPTPPPPQPESEPAMLESAAPAPEDPGPSATLTEVFPGIRIDPSQRLVEFDAQVSPLIFAPYEGRFFYLEQFVCKAGTKDHESLIVTRASPSQIHAALLLIGLEPGHPVRWDHPDGRPVARAAEGPAVDVWLEVDEGDTTRVVDPRDWTTLKGGNGRFPQGAWVFAGSAMAGAEGREFYEADAAGTVVGLASFGTEVIAWPRPISHEEAEGQMEWVADLEAMPPAETPVVVRLIARD